MAATATRTDGSTRITLTGPASEADVVRLRELLVTVLWRERPPTIVIDLARDVVLDATAVGALLAARDIAQDQQMQLVVECASPLLASQLTEAGLPLSA